MEVKRRDRDDIAEDMIARLEILAEPWQEFIRLKVKEARDAGRSAGITASAEKAEQYLRMEENRPATGQRVAAAIRALIGRED